MILASQNRDSKQHFMKFNALAGVKIQICQKCKNTTILVREFTHNYRSAVNNTSFCQSCILADWNDILCMNLPKKLKKGTQQGPNKSKRSLREAPLKKTQGLFGHCPNSDCTPSLKRALWGTLFPDRLEQIPFELQFSLHRCPKPSWQGFRPPKPSKCPFEHGQFFSK